MDRAGRRPSLGISGAPLHRASATRATLAGIGGPCFIVAALEMAIVAPVAQAQQLIWERTVVGYPADVAVDSQGSVISLVDGGGHLLMKYDHEGELLWEARDVLGNHGAICLDPTGCILRVTSLAVVEKRSSDGAALWQTDLGSLIDDALSLSDVCCDSAGSIFVTGHRYGAFSARLGRDGEVIWWEEEAAWGYGEACSTDPWGNLLVAGREEGPLPYWQEYDWMIRKYASDGTKLWERREGGLWYDHVFAACTDGDGSLYVGGNLWIAKYDPDGNLVWLDPAGLSEIRSVAWDGEDRIYIGLYETQGAPQIACCDLDGNLLWVSPGETGNGGFIRAVACDGTECLAIAAGVPDGLRATTALCRVGAAGGDSPAERSVPHFRVFPNPVANSSIISLESDRGGQARVRIYDLLGREVGDVHLSRGRGWWNCGRESGRHVSPGVYVCCLMSGGECQGSAYLTVVSR